MKKRNKQIAGSPAAADRNADKKVEDALRSAFEDEAAPEMLSSPAEKPAEKQADDPETAEAEDMFALLIQDAEKKAVASISQDEFVFLPEETPEKEEETPAEATADPPAETEETIAPAEKKESKDVPTEVPADKPMDELVDKPSQKKPASILGICLPLVIICIVVSLMLAAVNMLTKDTIAANAAAEKQKAVLALFSEATTASLYTETETEEVYLAMKGNELLGCCVSLSETGFGGPIALMIGRDTSGAVHGVQIISMSETPGIGTKTKNDTFLTQYTGGETFVIGENLDAISGATISSRAITRAVNRALSLPLDFDNIAAGMGLKVHTAAEAIPALPAPVETEEVQTPAIPAETTAAPEPAETAPAETAAAEPASVTIQPVERTNTTNPVHVSAETVYALPEETAAPLDSETPDAAETTPAGQADDL